MIRSNVHVHTTWCDGADTPRRMAEAALALGFTDLGFSSHAPQPFDPTCPGLQDEAAYRADIAALRETYAGRLDILCGVEEDLYATVDHTAYDYVITACHYLRQPGGIWLSVDNTPKMLRDGIQDYYGGDAAAMLADYYGGVVRSVRTRRPLIVGHFDLVKKYNGQGEFFDEADKAYQDLALAALDAVLDELAAWGGLIEVNTGAWARGLRSEPYPAPFLLRHAAQRKAQVIITGDSHAATALNWYFDEAEALLRSVGFSQMTVLQGGRFCPMTL